jgi:pyruvate-ferredoxin/flavodoxin oxidoreductase
VLSCEERLGFWNQLRGIAGLLGKVDPAEVAGQVRAEMAQKLAAGLLELAAGGGGGNLMASLTSAPEAIEVSGAAAAPASAASSNGFTPAYIDSAECTACDECVSVNAKIFAYNDKKQAYVKDPKGGPFKDLVKAAEKCSARVIHPGTPADPSEKGVDKLMKRAEKFN